MTITLIGEDSVIHHLKSVARSPVFPEPELEFTEKPSAFNKVLQPMIHQLNQEFSQELTKLMSRYE